METLDDFVNGVELVSEFIDESIFFIVPVLWFLGVMLKNTPKVPRWSIVWLLTIIGVILSLFILGFNVYGIAQGVLSAAMAVLGYDLFKGIKKSGEKNKE